MSAADHVHRSKFSTTDAASYTGELVQVVFLEPFRACSVRWRSPEPDPIHPA
jgi:hypothetical protein